MGKPVISLAQELLEIAKKELLWAMSYFVMSHEEELKK